MIRGYRYRIYPTEEQKTYFAKAFGCNRFAYNYCVREHERAWKEEKKTLYEWDMTKCLKPLMEEKKWLAEADRNSLYYAAKRVSDGYVAYWEKIKKNIKPPREHKKGERLTQSYTTYGNIKVFFKYNLIQLPVIGCVRAKLHRRFYGEIKNITIKLMGSGEYYASLSVDERKPQPPMKPFDMNKAVGIDMGVHHFLTLSDGTFIEMPDVSHVQKRKAFYQRRLKKQKEGSKGYKETEKRISKLSERITRIRRDFHHKTATELCKKYNAICVETLNVEGMRHNVGKKKTAKDNAFNHKLANVGIGQFSRIIEETARKTGTNFTRIDRWEPTTKRCHVCGYINKDITLDTREWTCPQCGTHHDRDINAAINIKSYAKAQQPSELKEEKLLDESIISKQLPLVEWNIKSVKVGDLIDLRTEKVAGGYTRRPASQIDKGTTRPRLAFLRLETQNIVRVHRIAEAIGISNHYYAAWINGVRLPSAEQFQALINALYNFADECRSTKITSTEPIETSGTLLDMNRLAYMNKFSEDTFHHGKPFTWWRALKKTPTEIEIINRYYSVELPDIICKAIETSKEEMLKLGITK